MLIAKNRLPRRIYGNNMSEVEKLVVSGKTWFDATSTIPVEGSPELFNYTSKSMGRQRHFKDEFCNVASGKKANVLYKDSEGYCYIIDTTKGENGIVVRFNGTLEYYDPNDKTPDSGPLVIFDASDASIEIRNTFFYWLKSINSSLDWSNNAVWDAKLILCKYLPIVRSDLDPITTIVPKTRVDNWLEAISSGSGWVYVSEPKAGPQYNVLVKNQGTKDYNLKAKIGRLINTPTLSVTVDGTHTYYNDYSTITLESDDTWSDSKEQVFIDGTQS